MTTVDYRTHCAWCHAELGDQYTEWLPAFDFMWEHPLPPPSEMANRYCSARCVTARRNELFHRRKQWTAEGSEKWPRWCAEIPPELSAMIEAACKYDLGGNRLAFSRANVVRVALCMYLDAKAPVVEPAVSTTASDVLEVLAIDA